MDTQLAQMFALTCYANAALRGQANNRFFPDNSTCTSCESISFMAGLPKQGAEPLFTTIALNPDQWFESIARHGGLGLRLRRPGQNPQNLSDLMTAGFGGGRGWSIEVLRKDETSEFWTGKWEMGNRNAPDGRIWRVTYGLLDLSPTAPADFGDMDELIGDFRLTLNHIRAFAAKQSCGFTQSFDAALSALNDLKEDLGSLADLAPPGALNTNALALLNAANAAWVFGGMNSWNDLGFNDAAVQAEYEDLTDRLFAVVNKTLEAAASSSYSPWPIKEVPPAPQPVQQPAAPIAPPRMTLQALKSLADMLEFGMWNNQQLQLLFDTLDEDPQTLLPDGLAFIQQVAFHLTKNGRAPFARRALLASLRWSMLGDWSYAANLGEDVKWVLKQEGRELSNEEILQMAVDRDYGKESSTVIRFDASHIYPDDSARAAKSVGIAAGVTVKMPLTTFSGFLKQHDSRSLNPAGAALMKEAFTRFGGEVISPQAEIQEAERLIEIGVKLPPAALAQIAALRQMLDAGVTVDIRTHRRYAGGDGRLPRGCYATLCHDAQGNDQGTLNREMMEYTHPCYPGAVLVGDSSDEAMNSLLGHPVVVKSGYCALYVLVIPPEDPDQLKVFNAVYAETRRLNGADGPLAVALETKVEHRVIDRVIDLRLPETQQWFFALFQYGDGVHLAKPNGGNIHDFVDMLPTLMHPELGGCQVTHAIGSWMRTNRVNALIYPSARSNVALYVVGGELRGSDGWNLIDYRQAAGMASAEMVIDNDPWCTFAEISQQFGGAERQVVRIAQGKESAGSWKTFGFSNRCDALYEAVVRSRAPGN